ncbi:MAG: hypothetical protein HYY17_04810 [Planctomycetes bacterium]|nr:hypothetical protein [Planctomycetota bacterium]
MRCAVPHTIRWCQPMRDLVMYEAANGKTMTLMRYNPLNNDLLVPLNHDIPSIHGVVDVDWMFRVALHTRVGGELLGGAAYVGYKTAWNTARGTLSAVTGQWDRYGLQMPFAYASVFDSANINAPRVADRWLHGPLSLAQIFRPASEHVQRNCSCRTPLTMAAP